MSNKEMLTNIAVDKAKTCHECVHYWYCGIVNVVVGDAFESTFMRTMLALANVCKWFESRD